MSQHVRVGTRSSKLALAQTNRVISLLKDQSPNLKFEWVPIKTVGDQNPTVPLSEIGGKGVFISALEDALMAEKIDIAVHSLKDVTSQPMKGLSLVSFLKPESCADAWVSEYTLKSVPAGSVVGTGSMRRKALLKAIRPDIEVKEIRGNVDTRLRLLAEGNIDGLILSEAGLIRLGLSHHVKEALDLHEFVPAPGQGVIAIQVRTGDPRHVSLCESITDKAQTVLSQLELLFLETVSFNCEVPLGLHTQYDGLDILINVFLSNMSLSEEYRETLRVPKAQAQAKMKQLAQMCLEKY
ncbi:MAG: hydroxymethylbilane synthase [Candidatus Margulisbacteria bacterium]|nr:hydroxymethylbilane synthase [Candidatus Margulisiibacteriota bacterium]